MPAESRYPARAISAEDPKLGSSHLGAPDKFALKWGAPVMWTRALEAIRSTLLPSALATRRRPIGPRGPVSLRRRICLLRRRVGLGKAGTRALSRRVRQRRPRPHRLPLQLPHRVRNQWV